jgi:aconitate hydratase 2 / 2-methylisocitrate dehydratase
MLEAYYQHQQQRQQDGLPPLPLDADQTQQLTELLINPPQGKEDEIVALMTDRIPPGVDDASKVKAEFLLALATGDKVSPLIDPKRATELLGTMGGGYNIDPLVSLLDNESVQAVAAHALGRTILMYDSWNAVVKKAATNPFASQVLEDWSNAAWFTERPALPESLTLTVFRVEGEINTDDFSPASEAWSRPDIPLHAQSMLINRMPNALEHMEALKQKGHPLVFVGDVVGTGSSRKSAINSLLWHIGEHIPYVPNKRGGGVVIGGKIAPIFFNTAEDSGALPLECDVSGLQDGMVIVIRPYEGRITDEAGNELSRFDLKPTTMADEVRAGGRIPLIIGRALTDKTREHLGQEPSDTFIRHGSDNTPAGQGYTLAQKMVGRACGVEGILPGTYCEPRITSVGSQDTTGGMTRDELKELACLGFAADLVMQSFCHTAAYPKPVDIRLQQQLPDFFHQRGGVALRPGDGIIHSWLNRMILPDTIGTGGDSHTRFPIGISFPAGSGLVAFAAALGVMPLDMPESVLVRFTGALQPGITLRDMVNAIPYAAIQQGLLTVEKSNKKNIFSGRILEIEGLPDLKAEQAFELADASAERSAAACTVLLNPEPIAEYLRSNIALLQSMIADGYQDASTIQRRIEAMQVWLAKPELLQPDSNAEYAAVIEIDMNTITEPLLACPNDPDDVKPLSEVAGTNIDEVFIGSCMTNIGHYRAAASVLSDIRNVPTRLWVAPPTRMDAETLMAEGVYSTFGQAGARMEMPGCSLCMGNQARVEDSATVMSTSTRNFPNRLGKDSQVFLGSAELAAVAAALGRLPSVTEYRDMTNMLNENQESIYRYLQFDVA